MKVLWFTNIMLPVVREHLGLPPAIGGGWMEALRMNLERYYPDISLRIAAFSNVDFESFSSGNATYCPIVRDRPLGRVKNILRNWKHTRYSDIELQQCIDLVTICNTDMIHVHGSENLFGLIQNNTDIPVAISLQGLIISIQNYSMPGLLIYDKLRIRLTKSFLKGQGPIHSAIEIHTQADMEKRILSNCRYFMGRTEWDRTIAKLMNPEASYYHVGRILREPFYHSIWQESSLEAHSVFSTISGAVRKGLLVLLDSIGILKRRGYEDIKLRLAGTIKDQPNWTLIKRRIANNQIKSNVQFLGPLSAEDLSIELASNSVFVHPSYIDNSPNSLAEAMIVGIPCVATAVGGIPSMLDDHKDGLLCTPGDPYSIAAAVNMIFSDENMAITYSNHAKERAFHRNDAKTIVNSLHEAYKDIIRNTNVIS